VGRERNRLRADFERRNGHYGKCIDVIPSQSDRHMAAGTSCLQWVGGDQQCADPFAQQQRESFFQLGVVAGSRHRKSGIAARIGPTRHIALAGDQGACAGAPLGPRSVSAAQWEHFTLVWIMMANSGPGAQPRPCHRNACRSLAHRTTSMAPNPENLRPQGCVSRHRPGRTTVRNERSWL
jgi:hypothetical protein